MIKLDWETRGEGAGGNRRGKGGEGGEEILGGVGLVSQYKGEEGWSMGGVGEASQEGGAGEAVGVSN